MHPSYLHRATQSGLVAFLLCLGIAPMRAQDAQQTPAPHPIHLPLPPDEDTPPSQPSTVKAVPAKPAARATTAKAAVNTKAPAPAVKDSVAAVKTPPVKVPAVASTEKTAASKTAAASPPKSVTTAKAAATPALPAVKTAVVPAAVPPPTAVAAVAKAEPAPEEVPVASAGPPPDPSVTFGFYSGETRSQIISAVGKENVLKQSGDILEVAAAPKPDPNFETFLLILSPKQGLVKLIATGKDIDADSAGHVMKTQFTAIKTDLSKGYGDPSDNFDFLDVKATHRGPNQFMLSLTNNERSLATYWTKKDFGNQITSVSLEGNGLGSDKGYLSLEYEFAGYHSYLLSKK